MHAVGAVAFFTGTTILAFHRHWGTPAEVAINLVALMWVFEGAGMLADPGRLRLTLANPPAPGGLKVVQGINMALGLYLIMVAVIPLLR